MSKQHPGWNERRVSLTRAEGKTLKRVVYGFGSLALIWSDRTFTLLEAIDKHGNMEVAEAEFDRYSTDMPQDEMVEAGVFTEAEIAEMREWEATEARASKEAAERAQFERLRRKFEGDSQGQS